MQKKIYNIHAAVIPGGFLHVLKGLSRHLIMQFDFLHI